MSTNKVICVYVEYILDHMNQMDIKWLHNMHLCKQYKQTICFERKDALWSNSQRV